MTIRIPKILMVVVGVLLALGGGAALGYVVANERTPDVVTTTDIQVSTTTVTTTTTESPAPVTGLGANVIADLLDRGAINEAIPSDPDEGWETEFELGIADTVIRFRVEEDGRRAVEWNWNTTPRGDRLSDAIDEVVRARGYIPVDDEEG